MSEASVEIGVFDFSSLNDHQKWLATEFRAKQAYREHRGRDALDDWNTAARQLEYRVYSAHIPLDQIRDQPDLTPLYTYTIEPHAEPTPIDAHRPSVKAPEYSPELVAA